MARGRRHRLGAGRAQGAAQGRLEDRVAKATTPWGTGELGGLYNVAQDRAESRNLAFSPRSWRVAGGLARYVAAALEIPNHRQPSRLQQRR